MTAKHTPGPWIANLLPDERLEILGDQALPIAVTCFYRDGTQQANARLIAAAPDLLAALEAIDRADIYTHERADAIRKCRAAIARATGQQ